MKQLLQGSTALLVLPLIAAGCDARNDLTGPARGAGIAAEFPNVVGSYAGTVFAHARLSTGQTYSVTCPLNVAVTTQSGDSISGTFTVQDNGECDPEAGTIRGTVQTDAEVHFVADTPGGGANIFEDAAVRTGCTLISSSGELAGTIVGGTLSASGNAVYECRNFFGVRAFVDVTVSATSS